MNIKDHSATNIKKMPMVELANLILADEKKEMNFKEAFAKVAELKGWTEEDKQAKFSQFYTDLNIDGRFVAMGSNLWGLKKWYGAKKPTKEIVIEKKVPRITKKNAAYVEEIDSGLDIDESIDEYDEDSEFIDNEDEDMDMDFDFDDED